jgi:hypothetical protein
MTSILAIERGEFTVEEIHKRAEGIEDEIRAAMFTTSLPARPRDQVGVAFKDLDVTSCAVCRMKYEKLCLVIKIQRRREKKDSEK